MLESEFMLELGIVLSLSLCCGWLKSNEGQLYFDRTPPLWYRTIGLAAASSHRKTERNP